MQKCPVCFKKTANYTTHCNHTFCKKCLYRWKSTCPLCRACIRLEYPHTRAMRGERCVINHMRILLDNIYKVPRKKNKLQCAEILLNYIWDNRIVIRKNGYLCDIVHRKSLMVKEGYMEMGLVPPKIIEKTKII